MMHYSPSTQPLPEEQSSRDDDETEKSDKYGYLILKGGWHEVPVGETKIGRNSSTCSIVLDDETVSMEHAVVESEGAEDTFIYDAGSTNKTKMGKMTLRPHCRYKINNFDVIKLGNTHVTFRIVDYKITNQDLGLDQQHITLNKSLVKSNTNSTNSSIQNEIKEWNNKIIARNSPEIFKISSMFLKERGNHAQKYYYMPVGEAPPAENIFSQATQLEVTDSSMKSELKCIEDDDIYNQSTQCDFVGDFQKAKNQFNCEKKLLEKIPSNKTKETIKFDLNDSGTFNFVRGDNFGNQITTNLNKPIDDIFEHASQCETVPNVSDIGNHLEGLSFKNILNQSESFAEKLHKKLKNNGNKLSDSGKGGKTNSTLMNNKDIKKLSNMMGINQSTATKINHEPIIFKNQSVNSELLQNGDEIFDMPTQIPNFTTNNRNEVTVDVAINKCVSVEKRDRTFGGVEAALELREKDITSNEDNAKEGNTVTMSVEGEDMILTQAFSVAHKIRETSAECLTLSHVTKTRNNNKENGKFMESDKIYNDKNKDEDFIATQLLGQGFQNNHEGVNSAQDETGTQLFQSNFGDQNGDLHKISEIVTEGSVKPAPDILLRDDSGDETESDLEIKLCLNSSNKKDGKVIKQEHLTSERLNSVDHFGRPSSSSSDKTVSDLDVAELQESSSSMLNMNNFEDVIATQIFQPKGDRAKLTSERTVFGRSLASHRDMNKAGEDIISTQKFPMKIERISPSEIFDKTESNMARSDALSTSSGQDSCNIEENSNESESLIKEIENFGPSGPVLTFSRKETVLTVPEVEKPVEESSLTLSPSHPAFEAFSEIDELIGKNEKSNDKSDSGIGAENFFEPAADNAKITYEKKVDPDSDETDCEQELAAMKRQETFIVNKAREESPQLTSKPASTVKKRGRRSLKKRVSSSIKSYFPPKGTDSPLKRSLTANADEGVQKKKMKSVEKRKRKTIESDHPIDVILTQSLKLRNRVIRQAKATPDFGTLRRKAATETKTVVSAPAEMPEKEKKSAYRKLMGEFQSAQDDLKKKSSRLRKCDESEVTKIVFTGFESDSHDKIIRKLGGERVNSLAGGHILVTDRVRRTVKFLSAVALGLPIVSPKWLNASAKEMKFLNPWDFLLEDKPSEERWGFNLRATLEKWRKQKLLNGYTVFATESTRPPVHEILSIAECCGGLPVTSRPEVWPEKSIVLTCPEDKKWWPASKLRHVKIVHYEFLLSGVLKNFMDFKSYKLR